MAAYKPNMIYKYISKNGLERLLEKRTLSLTRIDKWEDVYEGIMLQVIMSMNQKLKSEGERIAAIVPQMIYAQSWTYRAEESDAMWKIFARESGARICVYTSSICRLIKDNLPTNFDMIEPGNVSYNGLTEVFETDAENIESALLHKNIAYDYEHEYRFGIYNKDQWSKLKSILIETDADKVTELLNEIESEVKLNDDYFDFEIEADTIREMMLRYDISEIESQEIDLKCRRLGFKLPCVSNLHDKGLNF